MNRVREFLTYLASEEVNENSEYSLSTKGDVWSDPIMPGLRAQVEQEIAWIERRLRENREKYEDDLLVQIAGLSATDIAAIDNAFAEEEEVASPASSSDGIR